MLMQYQRDEHRVHLIVYHLIFCPKRRKPVLVGVVAQECERLINQKCEDEGWEILKLAVMPDHVHLFVRVFPKTSAAEVVRQVKGLTSRELRLKFPQLRRLPSMWSRSYFAGSAGNVSQETIAKYIEAQRGQ
jgi:putative transposase